MKHVRVLSAIGLLAVAGAANAGVTSTWTLTNDYDFRGISQTAKDPAIQASLDYAHDSGFYAGLWFSNVKFCDSGCTPAFPKGDLERDIYFGFTNKIGEALTYDVGVIDYTYNQHVYDFQEVYASLAYGSWIKGKLFYSPDFGGDATIGNTKAYAFALDSTIPLPANLSILAHAGYNWGNYFHTTIGDTSTPSAWYSDYSLGVGYALGKFNMALKYVNTHTSESIGYYAPSDDVFNNEARVVFTVATTFPWAD